jgi:hypothetical protein
MPQADQLIANASFPTVRADINSNLAALFSNNSGNIEPSPAAGAAVKAVAFMDWIDTSGVNPIWKRRNAANNAWITVATIVGNTISFEGTLPSQSGQSGKYLTTNGTVASWASTVAGLSDAKVFTASTTWICPAGVGKVLAVVIGGGGGGGAGPGPGYGGTFPGYGGGVGGYGLGLLTVTPGSPYTVTVGAGGTGGTSYFSAGLDGGTSTFSTISATGGGGGSAPGVGGAQGTDGSCSSLDANLRRSNVEVAIPPFVNAGAFRISRGTAAGTSPAEWAVDSPYSPGSYGAGGADASLGAGGVGGVIALFY